MLTSILTPVVHGSRSRSQWLMLAGLYSLANGVAAGLVGVVLAMAGTAIQRLGGESAVWGATLLLALLYLPREFGWTNWPPLVQSTRQVPRTWAYDYPRWGTALLFGLGLGSGLYTRIVVPTFYLLLVWPLLMPGWRGAVLVWVVYGLARSGNVWWLASAAPLSEPFPYAARMSARLLGRAAWMYRVNAVVMACVAAGLLAAVEWR